MREPKPRPGNIITRIAIYQKHKQAHQTHYYYATKLKANPTNYRIYQTKAHYHQTNHQNQKQRQPNR